MKIVVAGPQASFEELSGDNASVEWIKVNESADFDKHPDASAFFNLHENPATTQFPSSKILFINSVIVTLKELQQPTNIIRINGWKGFLKRNAWETTGINPEAEKILQAIGKRSIEVADEPGFIAARILAMIINEAYFAKGEAVSTEDEIDTAMRLGTNYPKGPFEWAREIGTEKIFFLLNKLKNSDIRYTPAPLLQKEYAPIP